VIAAVSVGSASLAFTAVDAFPPARRREATDLVPVVAEAVVARLVRRQAQPRRRPVDGEVGEVPRRVVLRRELALARLFPCRLVTRLLPLVRILRQIT
jgi:hypothetical protein